MARTGAIVLETAGDEYKVGGRIAVVQWVGTEAGALSNGDIVILRARATGEVVWRSRYPDSVGLNIGPSGTSCPNGYYVDRIDAGVLLVYMREET